MFVVKESIYSLVSVEINDAEILPLPQGIDPGLSSRNLMAINCLCRIKLAFN